MNNKYSVVPTGITQVDYPTAANYFAMGYTSMMITGSNALGVAYSSSPALKGKIGSFAIPGSHPGTMLNTEGYALCTKASADQKAAAIEYLKFFSTNDKDLMFWQSSGKIPSTIEGEKASYISGEDYVGYLETIKKGCYPTVTFPGFSGVKSALGNAYSAVFSKQITNEQAVSKLNSDLTKLFGDY
jgi:multiple sugar transport system substrate-binding protein